ncbi:MAG TPA: ribonuclease III [Caulobacteraceae bacterium]|jgi:ribonuclease-3|nr:ribonuclease III [Caulobacteraceae bacterium]
MNARADAVGALERRLGRAFQDPALLERALTHASVGGGAGKTRDNEVLEFIGDRVIGLLAAERLAELYPQAPEGELTVRLHGLVNRDACARVARRMGLGPALRLAGGETKTGGREKDSILGDACEAVMAAVYSDGGLTAAREVFVDLWSEEFDEVAAAQPRDPKTALQEWSQGQGKALPSYTVLDRSGPDHEPLFKVQVMVEGVSPAIAQGRSRREAEKAAAAILLEREAGS